MLSKLSIKFEVRLSRHNLHSALGSLVECVLEPAYMAILKGPQGDWTLALLQPQWYAEHPHNSIFQRSLRVAPLAVPSLGPHTRFGPISTH